MPKDIDNIEKNIMSQIHQGKIKMRPKIYFIAGSILTFIGFVSTIIVSTFTVGLVKFSLRAHGPMSQYKLDQILSNFPWWIFVIGILSLIIGIWIIHRYNFLYKVKPWIVIIVFIFSILVAGWIIDETGINVKLFRQGPMKGFMHNYIQKNTIPDVVIFK